MEVVGEEEQSEGEERRKRGCWARKKLEDEKARGE